MDAQDKLFATLINKPTTKADADNGYRANGVLQAAHGSFDGFLLPAGGQQHQLSAEEGKGREEVGGVDEAMEIFDKFQFQ